MVSRRTRLGAAPRRDAAADAGARLPGGHVAFDGQQLVSFRSWLYLLGGRSAPDGPFDLNIYASQVRQDGGLEPWKAIGRQPGAYADVVAVRVQDLIFVLGGGDGAHDVFHAPINPDGRLGAWVQDAGLPFSRQNFAAAPLGNRIVVSGGASGGALAWVPSGEVQLRGGLFWDEDPALLEPVQGHALAAYGRWLYLVAPSGAVYSAAAGADGRLGAWSALGRLPQPREQFALIAYAGALHVIGGSERAGMSAPILLDVSLGDWRASAALPAACASARPAATCTRAAALTAAPPRWSPPPGCASSSRSDQLGRGLGPSRPLRLCSGLQREQESSWSAMRLSGRALLLLCDTEIIYRGLVQR